MAKYNIVPTDRNRDFVNANYVKHPHLSIPPKFKPTMPRGKVRIEVHQSRG